MSKSNNNLTIFRSIDISIIGSLSNAISNATFYLDVLEKPKYIEIINIAICGDEDLFSIQFDFLDNPIVTYSEQNNSCFNNFNNLIISNQKNIVGNRNILIQNLTTINPNVNRILICHFLFHY